MIFVTGGTGLVGAYLLHKLVKNGGNVLALKRPASSLKEVQNIFSYYNDLNLFEKINWVNGDILDAQFCIEILKDVDYVYHCAAFVSFLKHDIKSVEEINVYGTTNIVNACQINEVKKLCFVSSIAALDSTGNNPISEKDVIKEEKHLSAYPKSKFRAEMEVWRAQEEGLSTVILNPGVILGAGFWGKGSGAIFSTLKKGLKYYIPGETGYVDVKDVVILMIYLMNSEIYGERYIAVAENIETKELLGLIATKIGAKVPNKIVTTKIAGFAAFTEKILAIISNRKPRFSKALLKAGMGYKKYDAKKSISELDFKYTPIYESISEIAKQFLKDLKNEKLADK